ncbi:MAG: hypothetical protein ACXWKW_07505 [Asticcacaulis sp.]
MGALISFRKAVAATVICLIVPASAVRADDRLSALSQRPDAFDFAVNRVCVPWLRQAEQGKGAPIEAYTGLSGMPSDIDGRPAIRLHGFGHVRVAAGPEGCTILSPFGDGRAERRDILKILEKSYLLETIAGPNEAVLHSHRWSDLRETYCFRLDERVVQADITTARGQDGADASPALRLRLSWSDAGAMRSGVCRA